MIKLLEEVFFWNLFRSLMNKFFGIYSIRINKMKEWGVGECNSFLDIACGSGHYSILAKKNYLGVDLSGKYIDYATKKYGTESKKFVQKNILNLDFKKKFDQTLMVGILHHLNDNDALFLLKKISFMADKFYFFEPISDQKKLIARIMIKLDRGKFIRPEFKLTEIILVYFEIYEKAFIDLNGINTIAYYLKRKI